MSSVLRLKRKNGVLDGRSLLDTLDGGLSDTLALLSTSLLHVEHFQQVVVAEVAFIAADFEQKAGIARRATASVLTARLVLKAKPVEYGRRVDIGCLLMETGRLAMRREHWSTVDRAAYF